MRIRLSLAVASLPALTLVSRPGPLDSQLTVLLADQRSTDWRLT